ncbi:hypothetical protein GCWU000325_00501 [Alloprevotella tannerae ATCC 51259]|uniref:Uncharacterized protein n=1 Tax=Alloprevotella tannerae ATCC 51259 TaxID=626522 RepID=C9LE77_9BACT|nr:hypothetical protein GCWU000325_00501 [Alloprevotella tannerae ATCC 51259]
MHGRRPHLLIHGQRGSIGKPTYGHKKTLDFRLKSRVEKLA